MKEIKLGARLSAYSKVDATTTKLEEVTKCDVDKMFGDKCDENCPTTKPTNPNEVSYADIDALFGK